MTRQLVFVHGRSQQNKDADALKAQWIEALEDGLSKSGLPMPIAADDIRFPFYGDTLHQLVAGAAPEDAARVIVRGDDADPVEREFVRAVLEEIRIAAGITEEQLVEVADDPQVIERGPQEREWVQSILRALDRYVPFASGASIALATRDVYQYLQNSAIRNEVDEGISAAIQPGVETVVVGHSLGSVVAYNLLRREGHLRGWTVPLFLTVGSPLGVERIRKTLRLLDRPRCPECVSEWHNAMDERDIVALYPLTPAHFPLNPTKPAITNRTDIRNRTDNRHGIAGYLDDPGVAKVIHDALTA